MAWASTEAKITVQARSVLTSSPLAHRQAVKPGTARDWSAPGPSSNSTQRAVSAYSQTYGRCSGPMPMHAGGLGRVGRQQLVGRR